MSIEFALIYLMTPGFPSVAETIIYIVLLIAFYLGSAIGLIVFLDWLRRWLTKKAKGE
jgi:uncharacterized membrane protein YbhN (UPF0104 family)